jgi:hypothetical protein
MPPFYSLCQRQLKKLDGTSNYLIYLGWLISDLFHCLMRRGGPLTNLSIGLVICNELFHFFHIKKINKIDFILLKFQFNFLKLTFRVDATLWANIESLK